MATKSPREITLQQLKIGMFVSKLDIAWIDSPFLTHSRKIKSEKDIALLKKAGVKKLTIDPNKGIDLRQKTEQESEPVVDASVSDEPATESLTQHPPVLPPGKALEKELSAAINIRSQVKKAIANLHNDLNSGKAISIEDISPLIDDTLESLERHNQALLNLAHISKRSQKLADHTFSTFCIALNLAQLYDCTAAETEALGIAALAHEAGWAQIPLQLMGKRQAYTANEIALIEKHPELGVKALASSNIPALSIRIIAEHHETCDGHGYPNRLMGNDIHPLSQMLGVVDRYDELIHQLNDQPGMLPSNALRWLYTSANKGVYCLTQVTRLVALLGIYPISSAVKLSNGAKGVVREVSADDHMAPTVEVLISPEGKRLDAPYLLDLRKPHNNHDIKIHSIIDIDKSRDDVDQCLTLSI